MIKWYLFWGVVFIAGVLAVLYLPHCMSDAATSSIVTVPDFDKDHAWKDLTYQVDAGYRIPGTDTQLKVRDWLVKQLTESASSVTTQPFSHQLNGKKVAMWNIIATYQGTGNAPRELAMLSAHWDSRPIADNDPVPANRTLPIPGADDGASGVAVLLEIGRQLKLHPISRDVVIVLFDGEDFGPKVDNMLLGSKYYAGTTLGRKPNWGILLDMIGKKNVTIYREPNSDKYAKAVNDRIFQASRELGYKGSANTIGFIDEPYKMGGVVCPIDDDHMPLNRAGIPTVDLIDFDYPAWHTRDDNAAQCSADSLALVGKTVMCALQLK